MRILHLSADYPDTLNASKTQAVFNLLQLAPIHAHRVYSLNRTHWRDLLTATDFADANGTHHRAIRYPALPKGFLHHSYLTRLADWIAQDCEARGFRPDLVHAHKLTIEGIAGQQIARCLNIPLIISAQGNTDLKVIRAKPGLRHVFADIWQNADIALPFAPWTRDALDHRLGKRSRQVHMLPCPGPSDKIISPTPAPPVIRTAFHLADHRNKNALRLMKAIGLAAQARPDLLLEIIGGGNSRGRKVLEHQAQRHAKGHVRFLGPIPNTQMQALLNSSAAFALVSHRESFGMVFAEALLAGTPCLIPRGRAIDGYLPEGEVTLSADPGNTAEMACKLLRLVQEQQAFKTRLRQYQDAGKLDFLRQPAIAETYATALEAALNGQATALTPQANRRDNVAMPETQPA